MKVHYNSKTSFFEMNSSLGSTADFGSRSAPVSASFSQMDDVFNPRLTHFAPADQARTGRHSFLGLNDSLKSLSGESAMDGSEATSLTGGTGKKAVKKANLYAWLSLQSLPEVSCMHGSSKSFHFKGIKRGLLDLGGGFTFTPGFASNYNIVINLIIF